MQPNKPITDQRRIAAELLSKTENAATRTQEFDHESINAPPKQVLNKPSAAGEWRMEGNETDAAPLQHICKGN